MKRLAAFIAALTLAASACAQTPTVPFDTSFALRGTAVNALSIGCKAFTDTSFDNGPVITAYYADKTNRLPLDYGGERYRVKSTITLPAWCGYGLGVASSICEIRGDDEFTHATAAGGPAGGLVWDDAGELSGPMIDYKGYGTTLGGSLWGYHAAARSSICPSDAQTFTDFSQNYKQIGLRVQQNQNGIGVGKLACPNLAINAFNIGIQYGVTHNGGGNGDECWFGALRMFNCDVGIKHVGRDTCGCVYDSLHQVECPIGYMVCGGGHLRFGFVMCGGPHALTFLQIGDGGGSTETIEVNNAAIVIDTLRIDGTIVSPFFTIVDSKQMSWAQVTINNLQLGGTHNYTVSTRPLATIGGAETLKINWGSLLRDNCIKTIEREGHYPVLIIGGRFYLTESPYAMIRGDSTGGSYVYTLPSWDNTGQTYYPPCVQFWNNGVLQWQKFATVQATKPSYP